MKHNSNSKNLNKLTCCYFLLLSEINQTRWFYQRWFKYCGQRLLDTFKVCEYFIISAQTCECLFTYQYKKKYTLLLVFLYEDYAIWQEVSSQPCFRIPGGAAGWVVVLAQHKCAENLVSNRGRKPMNIKAIVPCLLEASLLGAQLAPQCNAAVPQVSLNFKTSFKWFAPCALCNTKF